MEQKHPKNELQELCQKRGWTAPIYKSRRNEDDSWAVSVELNGMVCYGSARNKTDAAASAATKLLQQVQGQMLILIDADASGGIPQTNVPPGARVDVFRTSPDPSTGKFILPAWIEGSMGAAMLMHLGQFITSTKYTRIVVISANEKLTRPLVGVALHSYGREVKVYKSVEEFERN